jgi:hypothetical protein
MAITSKVLNGQGPRTFESSRVQENNRLRPADTCCGVLPSQQREEISAGQAWCGPGALAALLATLATALLTLIVVRLWLKLEKAALSILHPVRTYTSLGQSAPGQRESKGW